jgi:hypothetical protein
MDRRVMRERRVWKILSGGLLPALLVLPTLSAGAPLPEPAAAAAVLNGKTLVLRQGATYRARLKLSFFQCFAPQSKIAKKLGERGFSGVRVFTSARQLPGDWPSQFRDKVGSCERYAQGTWARKTGSHSRPSAIEKLWLVSI